MDVLILEQETVLEAYHKACDREKAARLALEAKRAELQPLVDAHLAALRECVELGEALRFHE